MPADLFSCGRCWRELPLPYRRLLTATYAGRNLFPRDHRQAIIDARRWYLEHPLPTREGVIPS